VLVRVHRPGRAALLLLPLLSPAALAAPAGASGWPQLWGPAVSGAVDESGAAGGGSLRELWRRPIGSGFSAIVVDGERGYTGESDGTIDHVIAFDVRTGKTVWRAPLGETYRGHDGSRDGPVATPAVDGSRVFMAGPRGALVALDAASGRELWRKDLLGDPQTKAPFYGFGASPIVAAGKVVLQVGGAETSGLVAFDAATGALAWTARPAATKGDSAGYTMAVPWSAGSERHVVVTGHDRVFAVRVADGGVAWSHALAEAEEPTRAPLVIDEARVLVSRGRESALLKLTRDGAGWTAAESWKSPRIKGGISPTVHDGGALYGFSGQYLVCLDAATGEPRWREKTNAGTLIRVGRTLVVLGEQSGVIRVAQADATAYRELARASAFNAGAQSSTGPSYADGRVFVRNVEEMVAYALGGGAAAGGQP
jgi:outer membrane protein assembly factor BamB